MVLSLCFPNCGSALRQDTDAHIGTGVMVMSVLSTWHLVMVESAQVNILFTSDYLDQLCETTKKLENIQYSLKKETVKLKLVSYADKYHLLFPSLHLNACGHLQRSIFYSFGELWISFAVKPPCLC